MNCDQYIHQVIVEMARLLSGVHARLIIRGVVAYKCGPRSTTNKSIINYKPDHISGKIPLLITYIHYFVGRP